MPSRVTLSGRGPSVLSTGGGGGGRTARGTARYQLGGREQSVDLVARGDHEEVAAARRAPRTGEGQRLAWHLTVEVVHLVSV